MSEKNRKDIKEDLIDAIMKIEGWTAGLRLIVINDILPHPKGQGILKKMEKTQKKTNKQCMVTGCLGEVDKLVFDGNFYIKTCSKHAQEFREFALDNSLKFVQRDLCVYCKNNPVTDFTDACNICVKKAEQLGCDVSDLNSLEVRNSSHA